MSQRFEGHNLEDALDQAASSLGVARYQLTHRVLVEKRGFLGGIKRVVIDVDVNQDAAPPAAAPVPPAPVVDDDPPPPRRESRAPRTGGRGAGGRAAGGRGRGGRGRERNGNRREDDLEPGDFERFAVEIPEQGPESEGAAAVRGWCEQVLSLAKLTTTVRTDENDEQINVRLYGGDSRRFTERHGELLDALQVLANKALVGRSVEKDIELDCEAFKQRRLTDLEERARDLADRVRRDGREQLLPAMSPIERRIVHLALQNDDAVTTESRGDGFYKRVAVIPRPAATES
jgi:spoIIIJ-associated protein